MRPALGRLSRLENHKLAAGGTDHAAHSESIGTLGAALAKAQCELVNPEKSLIATIASDKPGEAEQTFNYASLASGLEIVRKTLEQHEIAVAQTTSIDQAAGTFPEPRRVRDKSTLSLSPNIRALSAVANLPTLTTSALPKACARPQGE